VPRVRDSTHPMKRLLLGYEVNGANLATAIGCSEPTARKKLADPSRLTLGDLELIHRKFGIPCEEIRERVL